MIKLKYAVKRSCTICLVKKDCHLITLTQLKCTRTFRRFKRKNIYKWCIRKTPSTCSAFILRPSARDTATILYVRPHSYIRPILERGLKRFHVEDYFIVRRFRQLLNPMTYMVMWYIKNDSKLKARVIPFMFIYLLINLMLLISNAIWLKARALTTQYVNNHGFMSFEMLLNA